MNGLDNVLNKLSEGLDINNKALQSLYEALGGNFEEVYSKLSTEYSIYVISQSILITSIIVNIILVVSLGAVLINYSDYDGDMTPVGKKAFKAIFISLCVGMTIFMLDLLTPLLYPNLSLILGVLDRLGGK